MDQLVDELQQSGKMSGSPANQAQALFEFMHRRVLCGGYQLECTDSRSSLDEGRFNCVSASVLFNCLADDCGLDACGLEMPGHAMGRLILPRRSRSTWRRPAAVVPADRRPRQAGRAGRRTIGHRSQGRIHHAREVSPVEMVAMIYYNRGVDLLAERRYDEAASPTPRRCVSIQPAPPPGETSWPRSTTGPSP